MLSLGFSHPVEFEIPKGITITVDKAPKAQALIRVEGIDKQFVGEVAAKIRAFKKPEPYKGKGIRYIDEEVKLKSITATIKIVAMVFFRINCLIYRCNC